MKIIELAAVCHAANKVFCDYIGDNSQPPWEDAPDWQKKSAVTGVRFAVLNPDVTPEKMHESWFAEKVADGWKYGPVKDEKAKTHPCMLPYEKLPPEQQAKDNLFKSICLALRPLLTDIEQP